MIEAAESLFNFLIMPLDSFDLLLFAIVLLDKLPSNSSNSSTSENSTKMIKDSGCGYIIYLRQEGRGIGLLNKIKAYQLQDQGLDTVQANECLGLEVDKRDYAVAAKILQMFAIESIDLMTNNPDKINVISSFGIKITNRVPLIIENDPHSKFYIETKRDKLGHML